MIGTTVKIAGPVQLEIERKLRAFFRPDVLEVVNESHMHAVAADAEMHFKVVVVSSSFEGTLPLSRHREVHKLLDVELNNGLHALSISTFTPEEWTARSGSVSASPACRGGS